MQMSAKCQLTILVREYGLDAIRSYLETLAHEEPRPCLARKPKP
jgi:hypothetical protein